MSDATLPDNFGKQRHLELMIGRKLDEILALHWMDPDVGLCFH